MVSGRMHRSLNRRTFTIGAASLAGAATLSGTASAQDATPQIDDVATPTAGLAPEVVLSGLADPRFIEILDGNIYFTESGTGGDEAIFLPDDEETPISQAGRTGKVSVLAADGTVTEIANDLMSYTFGAAGEIVGPAGVAPDGEGNVYVSVGAPGPYVETMPRTGEEGVLLKINIETGEREVVSDLIAWEVSENPDPATIDSNPYGIAYLDGVVYTADAGGNTVLALDVASGETSTFAVTGGIPAEFFGEAGNPLRDGAAELDSVPSNVTVGPDGRLYVGYVTGGPFPPGFAPVDAFSPDGTVERVVEGLTMTGDIAFDSTGTMYATIVSTDLINGGPGQVVRIEADGSITVVIDGLMLPAGLRFDAADNLFVINKSSMVPGGGELLKYTGVTSVTVSEATEVVEEEATPAVEEEATPTTGEEGAADGAAFHIDFIDTAFEPSALTIPANTDVTITFENKGFLAHDFVIDEPKYVSDVLANGGTAELVLNLAPGTYTFYCSQVGHRAMGMEGELTVE